ncbi:MAG: TspO/MBR family protein [Rhodospirillales bacterium]
MMSRSLPLRRDWPALGLILAAVALVLVLGNRATLSEIPTWYASLTKPSWTPPNWLFGPVWTALYAMMAAAAWLVWRRRRMVEVRPAMTAWALQLALNLAWSLLFFGQHAVLLGLIDIAALWLAIVATIVLFWPIRPLAGALLLPYLAWVSYALSLNVGILTLN